MENVKAILFDVFGTVVDWRGSIIAEGFDWEKRHGLTGIDWARFADRWRAGYFPSMERVRMGDLPWTKLDGLHRMTLDGLLEEFQMTGLDEDDKEHWNKVWHRLRPWPDSIEGLTRLKRKFMIASLSNGNVSLLAGMAKQAGLPWDLILSAEFSRHYKPDPEAYLSAVEALSLEPAEVIMAAAHRRDLEAARRCGLRTAFIHRPDEYGSTRVADAATSGDFDTVAEDILDLAAKLDAETFHLSK
jgi:2-haloacid dehalogenase